MDKACFQHDMAYGNCKDLGKRTQSDKVLKDKAFAIANNAKYDGYQRGLASMVYKFFEKKSNGSGVKNEITENQQLANELHRFSKYAFAVPLKDKKGTTIANAFQSILNHSKRYGLIKAVNFTTLILKNG